MTIETKRIYDEVSEKDGKRILVDRIWPRGVSKEKAKLDEWLKEIAPSTELRKWFNEDPDHRFNEFKQKYEEELNNNQEQREALNDLKKWAKEDKVTLLYAKKAEEHNHAQVLKELIEK